MMANIVIMLLAQSLSILLTATLPAFAAFDALHQQRLTMQQEARGQLGVFSDFAVGDAREQFWSLMGVRGPYLADTNRH